MLGVVLNGFLSKVYSYLFIYHRNPVFITLFENKPYDLWGPIREGSPDITCRF